MLQGKELILKSLIIATEAHKGQFRRDGQTHYIQHPIAVAMNFDNPILKSIAYLHDVLEDTDIEIKDLVEQKIPAVVINIVGVLTKRDDEKYLDYILRVKQSPFATLVKIKDIKHNYPTTHKSKQERYDMALYILRERNNEPINS